MIPPRFHSVLIQSFPFFACRAPVHRDEYIDDLTAASSPISFRFRNCISLFWPSFLFIPTHRGWPAPSVRCGVAKARAFVGLVGAFFASIFPPRRHSHVRDSTHLHRRTRHLAGCPQPCQLLLRAPPRGSPSFPSTCFSNSVPLAWYLIADVIYRCYMPLTMTPNFADLDVS